MIEFIIHEMMKKIYLLLFAVLAVLQLSAQDRVTQIREKLMNRDQSSVIVVAHRGDWRNFRKLFRGNRQCR